MFIQNTTRKGKIIVTGCLLGPPTSFVLQVWIPQINWPGVSHCAALFKGKSGVKPDRSTALKSDSICPQTTPPSLPKHMGPLRLVISPYTPGLWWFTASAHSPYKHIILTSSSRLFGDAAGAHILKIVPFLLYKSNEKLLICFLYSPFHLYQHKTLLSWSKSTLTVRC